jgi:hypothetical protein
MNKFIVTFSALVIVAALSAVAFLSLADANLKNAQQAGRLADLEDQYDALQAKYYSLLGNFSYLEWNYTNVLLQPPAGSVPNPSGSGATNGSYLSRYEALEAMYTDLKQQYDQFLADYQKLRSMTDQRLMFGEAEPLITPYDPDVVNVTRSVVGEISNESSVINWGDIKALYDWVNNNIKYREDSLYPELPANIADIETKGLTQTDQMAQFPNETLRLRMGDCEDTAVLLASMLRAYFNKQFTVECIWITGETAGHVATMIPFSGDKLAILDPVRDYYSHDTLGDIALNSVSTEIYNWMSIWRPSLGNDVHVYRVFSDYMDKYFDSTEEFTVWMYSR